MAHNVFLHITATLIIDFVLAISCCTIGIKALHFCLIATGSQYLGPVGRAGMEKVVSAGTDGCHGLSTQVECFTQLHQTDVETDYFSEHNM